VPSSIVVNLNACEQMHIRKQMRRLRLLCPLLRLHILLLLAQQRSPTEIADWLLCSRSSVYEVAACWRQGWRPGQSKETEQAPSTLGFAPSLRRSLLALLAKAPRCGGLVPHALELCELGVELRGPAWPCSVGRDRAALVTSVGLALEAH
jgi:Homeodomain-like domain